MMSRRHIKICDVICRLCQSTGSEMLNIFEHDYDDGLHLTTKIMACAAVTVFEGDGLPHQICKMCLHKVNSFFTFKQTCERSDSELRQCLCQVQSLPQDSCHKDSIVKIEHASVKEEIEEEGAEEEKEEESFYDTLPEKCADGMAMPICDDQDLCADRMVDRHEPCSPDSPLNLSVTSRPSESLVVPGPIVVKQEMPTVKMEADTSVANESPSSVGPMQCIPLSENYEGLLGKLVQSMYTSGKNVLLEKCVDAPVPIQPCELSVMGSLLLYQTLAGGMGGRHFRCHMCGKAFRKKSGLSDHVRAHLNRKAYKCRYCWKSYAQRAGLRSHERLHEGTQAFVCRVCHKAFTQRSHLVEHLRIHTGERPYACRACDRTFAKSWNLKCHEKSHCLQGTHQAVNTCC